MRSLWIQLFGLAVGLGAAAAPGAETEVDCCNGVDDDGDGQIDFDDADCASAVCPCLRDEPYELFFSDGMFVFGGLQVRDGDLELEHRFSVSVGSRNAARLQAFRIGVRVARDDPWSIVELTGDGQAGAGPRFTDELGGQVTPHVVNRARVKAPEGLVGVERGRTLRHLSEVDVFLVDFTAEGFVVDYVSDGEAGAATVPGDPGTDLCLGNELLVVHLPHRDVFFRRGDVNGDNAWNLTDVISVLNYLFQSGREPPCLKGADINDDGVIDISDPVFLLAFLFVGGAPPPSPFPDCGAEGIASELACDVTPLCP